MKINSTVPFGPLSKGGYTVPAQMVLFSFVKAVRKTMEMFVLP